MPIHLPAQHRRAFIGTVGMGILACSANVMADDIDPPLVYFLNDTHIGEKHPADSPVPTHLRQAVEELVGRARKPACVIVNGDLALRDGQAGDYVHFAKLLAPLQEAKIDVHLTMGNHDNREAFYGVLKSQRPKSPLVESRHISVVQTRFANFFLLDTLQKTMVTQGTVGGKQREWLAEALDANRSKPAIIVAHHNPRLGGDPLHFPGGLIDSNELWGILAKQTHVKAYMHGHVHDRAYAEHRGIHILNLPATSYVADAKTSTTAWTLARFSANGVALTTRTTDETHPWNGETKELAWRGRS